MSAADNIRDTLLADPDLAAWIAATFPGKSLQVRLSFKRRTEINTADLPLVMITRPRRERAEGTVGRRRYDTTLLLYAGFHFDGPREEGPELLQRFEELIEDALLKDIRRGGAAVDTEWDDSSNDEGANHPVYFSVSQFTITTERSRP